MSKSDIKMIDIGDKDITERVARASALVFMKPSTIELIVNGKIEKGDVFSVAKVAGIMAAKNCPDIIPLCHPISLKAIDVYLMPDYQKSYINIMSKVKSEGQTGVEMEALAAVSAAALTVYDMCKRVDKEMTISEIKLLEKMGGRSGHYVREDSLKSSDPKA